MAKLFQTPGGLMTIAEASIHYGIPEGTLRRRVWNRCPKNKIFIKNKKKTVYFAIVDGKKMTVSEISKKYDVHKETIRWRIKNGRTGEALIKPARAARYYLYPTSKGMLSRRLAALHMGLSERTVADRVRRGWSREDAINTPSYGIRGMHHIEPPEWLRRE